MNPWKGLTGLSAWVMRIAMLMLLLPMFYPTLIAFNIQSLHFYIGAAMVVCSVLLLIGGFLSKHTITVVSSLILLILSGVQAYWAFSGLNQLFAMWVLTGSVALYFLSNGNK